MKHVLRALLYAIFFHRLMDNVEPETWDILETHVVGQSVSPLDNPISYPRIRALAVVIICTQVSC